MSNKDIYKDEFGNYHEVEDEAETPIDGFEDDLDQTEEDDDLDDSFDKYDEEDEDDEDQAYANERRSEYDSDED